MPKYLVETISTIRIRRVIDCKSEEHALDTVVCDDIEEEFSQLHLGETIVSSREIDDKEYLRLFAEDNDYLSSWTDEQKFKFVHKVEYPEDDNWEFS